MNKKPSTDGPSKRQAIREQRQRKERQKRLLTMLGIAAAALLVVALFAWGPIRSAMTPVGAITTVSPRTDLPAGEGSALGDPNAAVKIEVFEDFQCPACRNFSETVEPRIIDQLVRTGTVYYVFRHYPFIDDRAPTKESDQAANASMCAADQGKFWEYHDMLFVNWQSENQGAFNDRRLVAFAESTGLDMNAFNACFDENRFKEQIEADTAAATEYGVSGTPSVFVNGKIVKPGFVPTFEEIQQAVTEAQAASGG